MDELPAALQSRGPARIDGRRRSVVVINVRREVWTRVLRKRISNIRIPRFLLNEGPRDIVV